MGIPLEFLFALVILVASIWISVWAARRVRRGGGGVTVGALGATYEMLSEEKRRAAETIVKKNAGESEDEDGSTDPDRTRR